jgi:DNA ligase-1
MQLFAQLFTRLDETTRTSRKIAALVDYFRQAPPVDAIWAIHFLIGRRPKRLIPTRKLRQWAAELAGIPDWLFDASYDLVGDLAETITLVLTAEPAPSGLPLHQWVEERLLPLAKKDENAQRQDVTAAWYALNTPQRFVWNKLITGGFRVGVSRKLVVRALSQFSGVDGPVIAHRLMGHWQPTGNFFDQVVCADTADADISRPYPFYLAHPLDGPPQDLGSVDAWQIEWKWDGIRAQVIHRQGTCFVWSRGEDLVSQKFPEITAMAQHLPDGTVVDGELIGWRGNRPLDFGALQKRIGRKHVTKAIQTAVPVRLLAYDLLEYRYQDVRQRPLTWRVATLTGLVESVARPELMRSPTLEADSWETLAEAKAQARDRRVEGLMLKRRDSAYGVGRKKGDWWKWKVDPYRVDAVLIYAQSGHGRRAGLFTDYTLAVWDKNRLVPFAKAYSGLSDSEIRQVDRFVRRHTVERFGPVRSVTPELVFEIAFEGIRHSSRHKSGVAVRFPRIARWRHDKSFHEADSLDTIKALLTEDP